METAPPIDCPYNICEKIVQSFWLVRKVGALWVSWKNKDQKEDNQEPSGRLSEDLENFNDRASLSCDEVSPFSDGDPSESP